MKHTRLRTQLLMFAATIGMAVIPTQAMAHQVQTNYFINSQDGDSLELRTTFSNGAPLKGAKVTVSSPAQPFSKRTIGRTDDQGRFVFTPDTAVSGDWEVNIERAGHQDILTIPVNEEKIDTELMAQTGNTDVHYASSPWAVVGGLAVAAACVGLARVGSKKSV
ncbi:MAG: carboxypeptidase regulatory-like domain-containing protein [Cyanobacteria bacterium J06632_3]